MPGVASQLRDRPQRVHWLWASVVLSVMVLSGISFSQEKDDSIPDEGLRRSREFLMDPEELEQPGTNTAIDEETELSADEFLNRTVVDVVIEGRETIAEHAIQHYLKVKKGRVVTPREFQEDVAALRKTHWFSSVRPYYRESSEGLVLVYEVRERPIIRSVQFIGNKKIKTSELEAHTVLRVNQPFDVHLNQEAVARIKSLYLEKGFRNADVRMTKGGNSNDREVIITITEGPKTRVHWIRFEGNEFENDAVLKTKLAPKITILWMIGDVCDPQTDEN